MEAGLSLYDPNIHTYHYVEEPKEDATVQKNLAMLDMAWTLPSFKYADVESQFETRTSIDVALASEEPTEW